MVRETTANGVALIRRFNRTVTERIGVLEESFLGRDRPLGASRLLWEVGEDGADEEPYAHHWFEKVLS